jgi:hypothetical protein
VVVLVSAIAKKVASVSPDAVKQSSPLLEGLRNLVVLMKKPPASDLQTVGLQAGLMEEPLASDLHLVVDPLRADHHKEGLLQTETPAIKRLLASLIKTKTGNSMRKKEKQLENT